MEQGLGSIVFAAIFIGVFDSASGFTIDNASVPSIDCSTDTSTSVEYEAGDTPDYGTVSGTIQVAKTMDVNSHIGVTALLTITYAGGSKDVGNAFLISGPTTTSQNGNVLAALTFQWKAAPVFTAG